MLHACMPAVGNSPSFWTKPAFSRINQTFQPQFVVPNFREFVKRQVWSKMGASCRRLMYARDMLCFVNPSLQCCYDDSSTKHQTIIIVINNHRTHVRLSIVLCFASALVIGQQRWKVQEGALTYTDKVSEDRIQCSRSSMRPMTMNGHECVGFSGLTFISISFYFLLYFNILFFLCLTT